MRTALLAVAAVAAAGLVVPATLAAAGAAPPPAGTISYHDASQSQAASLSVSGTLTPIHHEAGADSYAVSLPGGGFIPVSLDASNTDIEQPRAFSGDVAITDTLADHLADRGVTVDDGDDVSSTSTEGKAVVAAASASTQALPVQTATIGSAPTQNGQTVQATATSTHQLYVAVITNRGTLDTDSAIATKLSAMRSYWTTESDGLFTSFTQPTATVAYASSAADSAAAGCGLANPTPVWNEAAAQFPGVNFNSAGNHLMVLVPNACGANGAAGIGTVGRSLTSGGRTIVTLGGTAVAIGVHELGHNLSLAHANAETCAPSCSTSEYWDLYSIMGLAVSGGTWTPASLDTSYRLLTGIDDSTSVPTVTASSTVHLSGRATASGTRGLVVVDPSSGAKYTVEYRSGTGRDAQAFYATPRTINGYVFRPGVVIERMEPTDGSTTMITRQSGSNYVTSFVAGDTVTRGSVTIAVTAASPAAGADVSVTLPSAASSSPAPTSSTPSAPASSPGSPSTPSTTPSAPSTTPSAPSTTPTPAAPPASFVPGTPLVQGTPRVGQRLSVATTPWSPAPQRYGVQWLVAGRPLPGATGSTLLLTPTAYGKAISVVLTGYRDGYPSAASTSTPTRPVTAGRFGSRTVRIVGHAKVGRRLTVATGSWDPSPTFTYRWYANGHAIGKATGRTLKVTKALRGKRITARVTAWEYAYEPASAVARAKRVR